MNSGVEKHLKNKNFIIAVVCGMALIAGSVLAVEFRNENGTSRKIAQHQKNAKEGRGEAEKDGGKKEQKDMGRAMKSGKGIFNWLRGSSLSCTGVDAGE